MKLGLPFVGFDLQKKEARVPEEKPDFGAGQQAHIKGRRSHTFLTYSSITLRGQSLKPI